MLERAYELRRDQVVSLPRSASGQIAIRKCAECDAIVLRVNSNTRYYSRPSPVALSLADWLAADAESSKRDGFVYVFYRPEDRFVTRIVLDSNE